MSVQKIVLKQFHESYPNAKLREISDKTGIQITRVFRILNGAEMKVSELESFQSISNGTQTNHSFIELSKKCALNLSANKRNFLQGMMEQSLKLHSFTNPPTQKNMEFSYGI